jgi:hypothetical protein
MRNQEIFCLDLIRDSREPISNALVIVTAGGRHEKIENPARLTEREPRTKFRLHTLQLWRCSSSQQHRQSI